jgi:hypothetical protein
MALSIPAVGRELLWLLVALAIGLLLLPPLIFLVGSHVFCPYAAGTSRDLVGHFFRGLGGGQPAFWIVALGPYLAILTLRGMAGAWRASRREE